MPRVRYAKDSPPPLATTNGNDMEHPAHKLAGDKRTLLVALGLKPNIYGDTVRHPEAADRRRKNKAARKARRTNRKH